MPGWTIEGPRMGRLSVAVRTGLLAVRGGAQTSRVSRVGNTCDPKPQVCRADQLARAGAKAVMEAPRWIASTVIGRLSEDGPRVSRGSATVGVVTAAAATGRATNRVDG